VAHAKILNEEETTYVMQALKSGTMGRTEIMIVLMLGRLAEKPVMEVQSAYMDCKAGIQQVFQDMAHEPRVKNE